MGLLMVALRSQGNWRWEGPLGTPLGLVHWKRASSPVNPSNKYSGLISFRIEIKPVNTKEISPEYSLERLMLKLKLNTLAI